jgi:hypothetical protein
MGPLSGDGSLELQEAAWTNDHRQQHEKLFAQCESLSTEVLSFLQELRVHNKDSRQLLTSSLLARCFQLHLALLKVAERGLVAPSDVLLRSLLVAVFTLAAIARHPDTLNRYISADHSARLKLLNSIRDSKHPELSFGRAAATDKLKVELEAKVASCLPPLNDEDLARRAGLHHWYVSMYRILSQSSHASVRDMERYFMLDAAGGEIEGLRLLPSDADTPRILTTAGSFLLTAICAGGSVFGVDTSGVVNKFNSVFENRFELSELSGV